MENKNSDTVMNGPLPFSEERRPFNDNDNENDNDNHSKISSDWGPVPGPKTSVGSRHIESELFMLTIFKDQFKDKEQSPANNYGSLAFDWKRTLYLIPVWYIRSQTHAQTPGPRF